MQIIQNAIRYHFSTKGHQIAEQDPTTLQIIMRSIYLQYSKNWSCKIKEQIKTLNEYVIAECIQSISTNINSYNHYIDKITSSQNPLGPDRAINTATYNHLSNNIGN